MTWDGHKTQDPTDRAAGLQPDPLSEIRGTVPIWLVALAATFFMVSVFASFAERTWLLVLGVLASTGCLTIGGLLGWIVWQRSRPATRERSVPSAPANPAPSATTDERLTDRG